MLVVQTSNGGENVFRSCLSYIGFGAGKKDFYSKHVEVNKKVSSMENSNGYLNASAVSLNRSNTRSGINTPLMNWGYTLHKALISCSA